jgi:hypothetical protein
MHKFETAWNEASWLGNDLVDKSQNNTKELPRIRSGIVGTMQAYLHYLDETGEARQYRLEDVDLDNLRMQNFKEFEKELEILRGKVTQKQYFKEHKYNTGNCILGNILLDISGTITSNETGWLFQGTITATKDTYDFNKSNRCFLAELATTIGRTIGELFGARKFDIQIIGEKEITDSGRW